MLLAMADSATAPVRQLTYEVVWSTPGFEQRPRRQQISLGGVACVLDDTRLYATAPPQIASLDDVRAVLEPALEAWALELELTRGWRLTFRLSEEAWDAECRPGQPQHFVRGIHEYLPAASDTVSISVNSAMPLPTGEYALSPEVSQWLDRLRAVRAGREGAPAAVYALLTHLEQRNGSRKAAAAALRISTSLLDRVGQLSSGYHPLKGRKTTTRQLTLSDADVAWLERAMALLVRRLAESAVGRSGLLLLTCADV